MNKVFYKYFEYIVRDFILFMRYNTVLILIRFLDTSIFEEEKSVIVFKTFA